MFVGGYGVYAQSENGFVSVSQGSSVPGCDATNECYLPFNVSVSIGEKITWSNDDSAAHTVTSGTPANGPDGKFDSGLFMARSIFSVTLHETGEYPYFCMVHPWMVGEVIVGSAPYSNQFPSSIISVSANKNDYREGEIIQLTVNVSQYDGSPKLKIELSINGILIGSDSQHISKSGTYAFQFIPDSPFIKEGGVMTAKVILKDATNYVNFNLITKQKYIVEEKDFEEYYFITTDKPDYFHKESIKITGIFSNFPDKIISLLVKNPLNSVVTIETVKTNAMGAFEKILDSSGSLWKYDGDYAITVIGHPHINTKITLTGGVDYTPLYSTPQLSSKSVTITTDKKSYSKGDTIQIMGTVGSLYSGTPVSVITKSPDGKVISIIQSKIDENKRFFVKFTDRNTLMQTSGTYTITAQYGTVNRSAMTTFDYQTNIPQACVGCTLDEARNYSKCGPGTEFNVEANSCILISSQKFFPPTMNEEDLRIFENDLAKWNDLIDIFTKEAIIHASKGDLETAEYFRYKIDTYETLIKFVEDLIQ